MPEKPPTEINVGSSKSSGWQATLLTVAMLISLPLIFPLGMGAWTEYKRDMRFYEIYEQNRAQTLPAFNKLCTTFIELSAEQKWHDLARQWSELCMERNVEYFENK